jgi:hypothetical protein
LNIRAGCGLLVDIYLGTIMLHDRNGQSIVEYIVILAIFLSLLGVALYAIFTSLQGKFNDVNASLNS